MIDTIADGSSSFTIAIGIKKIIEAIVANEHLKLYDRCTSKPKWVINLKLAINVVKLEDQVAVEVEMRLKALNVGTHPVA